MTNPLLTLPPEIQGSSAWYGPEMLARRDWIEHLSESEVDEVEHATRPLTDARVDITSIHRDDFPLPTLSPRLRRILDDTLNGRGFALIRSLPVGRWTKLESAVAFFGIGAHIGAARPQNAKGHALGHVKDLGLSSSDPNARIYQTRERQTFHTDSCDVVALLCLRPAKSGGLSSLVSSVTIFNEMRRRRPDLAKTLFEPVETDRRGEIDAGQKPYFRIPVFNWRDGLLSTIYLISYSGAALPVIAAGRLAATWTLFHIAAGYAMLGLLGAAVALIASRAAVARNA